MSDPRSLLERETRRFIQQEGAFERLAERRDRKRRNQRIRAGVLGVAIAIAVGWLGVNAIRSRPSVPADPPEPSVDLGIFAPVAGRIVYHEGSSLWGVDPNAASPSTTLVRLDPEGTGGAHRFASDSVPLGWSSDGTKLLLLRPDWLRPEQQPPFDSHLYILHADGTETRVTAGPVGDAAISPDGSRVAFRWAGYGGGLYVVDAEGGEPILIAQTGASPTFSPDGTQIAYLSSPPGSRYGVTGEAPVWVVDADGTDAHEILADEPALANAVLRLKWSPAGDRIAIHKSVEGSGDDEIYTFAPDGSDFTMVITGGDDPHWSPDGSRIAYTTCASEDNCSLAIADADGSNVRTFGFGYSGPWHPGAVGGEGEQVLDPTPSRFVGEWASRDFNEPSVFLDTAPSQTMTIRTGEDGVLHVTVHDDAACAPNETAQTMTGTGRLEDPTTLVVPSPDLTCVDGSVAAGERIDVFDGYTLVLDRATDRLYDSLGVVWIRGAPPESWTGPSTEAGVDGPGTFSMLYGEVTFRAAEPWHDWGEAYLDPPTFFLIGPGGEGDEAEMTILVNPLPPEAPCDSRVPPTAEELVRAVRSNPNLEATAHVIDRVGGIDALRMDVVAAPGASLGPCVSPMANSVDVVSVPPWGSVKLGDLGRLYVLDLPGGSARTLAILITAPDAAVFEQALDTAAPLLDSFEFHAP